MWQYFDMFIQRPAWIIPCGQILIYRLSTVNALCHNSIKFAKSPLRRLNVIGEAFFNCHFGGKENIASSVSYRCMNFPHPSISFWSSLSFSLPLPYRTYIGARDSLIRGRRVRASYAAATGRPVREWLAQFGPFNTKSALGDSLSGKHGIGLERVWRGNCIRKLKKLLRVDILLERFGESEKT